MNPVRDLDIIGEELRLKDEETLLKSLDKLERVVGRGTDKKLKPEYVSFYIYYFSLDCLLLHSFILLLGMGKY